MSSQDGKEWITAYLTVHSLSIPSRRYSFILWLAVLLIFLAFAILHWTGFRGGFVGAIWSKWALRRRTWRKKHTLAVAQRKNQPHRQPTSLPSNAQLLSLSVLALASLLLAFAGPDYLDPRLKVWQTRDLSLSQLFDSLTFVPYMPQYTIKKSLWSSAARVGQIAYALLPLCVLFALKAPPFAIFAIPFMIQLYFDKLAWLHRWAGRLIWFLVLVHVTLWSIQLGKDVNPSTGRTAYAHAWSYPPFIFGWIAFILLTLIILLSLHPIRRRFYEIFYMLHVLLAPLMLLTAGLHHPSVAWWCWIALAIWFGERIWRGTWWIYANAVVGGATLKPPSTPSIFKHSPRDSWEMGQFSVDSSPRSSMDGRAPSPLHAYYLHDDKIGYYGKPPKTRAPQPAERCLSRMSLSPLSSPYIPPPGYAHAELLSGRTVRLRLVTPGFLPWSPAQHFLLNIPSVSRFTSHPFTCASVCDEAAPTDAGRIMVFLIRAKGGWTQDLWNLVSRLTEETSKGDVPCTFTSDDLPKNGVLLRSYADGPFGSVKRARWGNYSTGIIITGGSGVSFGLSLLQYMCMCLAGRDGRHLGGRPGGWGWKGADMRRVRFIWLVREFSHLQWCASIIRYCTSIVPSSALQVDIYVTNFKPVPLRHPTLPAPSRAHFDREPAKSDEELEPPHPSFVRQDSVHRRSKSSDSAESRESYESDVDLSYYLGESPNEEPPADEILVAHETNILELTNFDGDVDMALPGEASLSQRLKKEGKIRRLESRRRSVAQGMKQDGRPSQVPASSEARTPRQVQDSRQGYADRNRHAAAVNRPPPSQRISKLSTRSADKLLRSSPLSERPRSFASEVDMPLFQRSASNLSQLTLTAVPPTPEYSTVSLVAARGPSRPFPYPLQGHQDVELVPENSLSVSAPPQMTSTPEDPSSCRFSILTASDTDTLAPFEMDDQEGTDVNVVSEHARPGKPKLDKVIAEEVEASKGAIVVACCGPTSLNAMVRKIVAARIDPGRIRRGDMRGSITLVSEEFEY